MVRRRLAISAAPMLALVGAAPFLACSEHTPVVSAAPASQEEGAPTTRDDIELATTQARQATLEESPDASPAREQAPLIVAGTVVDARANPVEGATIGVSRVKLDTAGKFLDLVPAGGAKSDARGRFEIRGRVEPGPLRIDYGHDKRSGTVTGLSVGDRGVVAQLNSLGWFDMPVLLDAGMKPRFALKVRSHSQDGPWEGEESAGLLRISDGLNVDTNEFQTGLYDVAICDSALDLILEVIESVEVPDGDKVRDPRVVPLDLRDRFQRVQVKLFDEAGAVVPTGMAWLTVHGDEDHGQRAIPFDNGILDLWRTKASYDVQFEAIDRMTRSLFDVRADATVTLPSGPRVRLRLAPDSARPSSRCCLLANLAPIANEESSTVEHMRGDPAPFSALGEWSGRSRTVGHAAVELWVRCTCNPGQSMARRVESPSRNEIDVLSGGGEQIFEIRVDAQTLARVEASIPSN